MPTTRLPQFSFEYYYSPDDVGLGNPTNPRAGCNFNGMTLPCSVVAKMASNGAARTARAAGEDKLAYDGFKEKLIAGGQNGWAQIHIAGID